MATALSNLLALLALDESAYIKGLDSSKKATDTFAGNLANVGGAIVVGALTAVGTAVVAVGSAAFDAAERVDEAFDSIAVATGAQGEELAQLQEDWKAVYTSVPTDAASAADAISILNSRLGWTGPVLQNTATSLLEMTRILGGDLTANGEAFTRMVGDWGLNFEDLPVYMDAVFVASQETGAGLDTLMQQLVQYGAPMRNFGFSFEEAGALLASFAAQGVNTEIVMSGLRIAQGKFIAQGKDMKTGLWETVDAIQNAATTTDALAIATEIFGAKAAGDMVDTIRSGKFELDGLVTAMTTADGAIMNAANATNDWGEKWQVFRNQMDMVLAPMGEKIREAFGSALDSVVEVFNRPDVQNAITVFADFAVKAIGKLVEYIPVVIDGFFQFVDFLKNNEGILIGVFVALAAAALVWAGASISAAISTITALLPVIAVIALIGLAAYLLYEAWTNNWGGIQEITATAIANIMAAVQGVVDFFVAVWNNPLVQQVVQTVLANVTALFTAFKAAFDGDWRAFGENLRVIWDNNWNLLVTVFQTIVPMLIEGAKNLITNVINTFQSTNWSEVGANIVRGIASGISGSIGFIAEAARSAASAALEAAKGFLGIQSPSKLFEDQIGANMALGMVKGWEGILGSNPLTPALASATVDIQPSATPTLGFNAQAPAQNDASANSNDELNRILRDLPETIARAVRDAVLKAPKR